MTNETKARLRELANAIAEDYRTPDDPLVPRSMVYFRLLTTYQDVFASGAADCREMMARFVEGQGLPEIAASIRANWSPNWGPDPGKPSTPR